SEDNRLPFPDRDLKHVKRVTVSLEKSGPSAAPCPKTKPSRRAPTSLGEFDTRTGSRSRRSFRTPGPPPAHPFLLRTTLSNSSAAEHTSSNDTARKLSAHCSFGPFRGAGRRREDRAYTTARGACQTLCVAQFLSTAAAAFRPIYRRFSRLRAAAGQAPIW